jgi:predicted HTH transcriptional regulator
MIILSRIKESIYGEVTLRLSHTEIDGATVAVIEIPQAVQKLVAVHHDRHLYVRAGASNQTAPPELWRSILYPEAHSLFGS